VLPERDPQYHGVDYEPAVAGLYEAGLLADAAGVTDPSYSFETGSRQTCRMS